MKILFLLLMFFLNMSSANAVDQYTTEDISVHSSPEDCWVSYSGAVYDLTKYVARHDVYMDIREWCGSDMTEDFETKAGLGRDHKTSSYSLLEVYRIGELAGSDVETDEMTSALLEDHEDGEEEYSIEISGQELKTLTVNEVAELWGIDPEALLSALEDEFDLVGNYSLNSTIDELKAEGDFAPKQVKDVAEDILLNGYEEDTTVDRSNVNPYNLFLPLCGTILVYWGLYFAVKKKLFEGFSLHKFNMIFNTILLLTLVPSFGFGIFMMLRYQFPAWYDIEFEFLYWHVELSVVMGTIAISHLLQRWAQYMAQIKSLSR